MKSQVAVVVPVFNGANTISRALDSVLGQHFDAPFEIIVVNDGSTDSTSEVLAQYGSRIRVLNQRNRGPAQARNAGVALSNAIYIAFLDADDAFMPDKLSRTVPKIADDDTAVLLYHDAIALNRDGGEIAPSCVPPHQAHAPSMQEMLRRLWPIITSTVVTRREHFDACGGFSEEFKFGYEEI